MPGKIDQDSYSCNCGQEIKLPKGKTISSFSCPICTRIYKVSESSENKLTITTFPSFKFVIKSALNGATAGAILGFFILANQIADDVIIFQDRLAGVTVGAIAGFVAGAIYKSFKV